LIIARSSVMNASHATAIMINVFRSNIGRKRVLNVPTPRSTIVGTAELMG
jgi:hypothetical protein